ncbi:MAG: TRIC cation channel family protein [Uliginosibacterium sp.]|nr:TRIC cation channel family protein [Uliginosibacterium sp.]
MYAITGALEAGHGGMDFVGAPVPAGLATAAGGGTVLDLLISRPVFWIQ